MIFLKLAGGNGSHIITMLMDYLLGKFGRSTANMKVKSGHNMLWSIEDRIVRTDIAEEICDGARLKDLPVSVRLK